MRLSEIGLIVFSIMAYFGTVYTDNNTYRYIYTDLYLINISVENFKRLCSNHYISVY